MQLKLIYNFRYVTVILFLIQITISCSSQHENIGILTDRNDKGNLVAKEYFISSEDKKVSLYIKEVGSGKPVIVLHGGFGNDHTNVQKIANNIESKYRFIFYDQRGSTLSYCEKENISVNNHINDLEIIRKKLDIEDFTLVSHSAGTVLALSYFEKYQNRVNNLILLGAMDPKNGNPEYFTDEEKQTWEIGKRQIEEFNSRPEIEEVIISLGLNKKGRNPNEQQLYQHIKYYAAQNIYHIKNWNKLNIPHWNPIAAKASSESFNWDYNFTKLLASTNKPVSVINGEYDYVVGAKGSPIWKSIIKNDAVEVNLNIIEEAGHLAWIDSPNEFRLLFLKALQKE